MNNVNKFGFCEGKLENNLNYFNIFTENPKNHWIAEKFDFCSWEFPRSLQSLETLNEEFANSQFPGIYLLFESKVRKVYISLIERV
ncbi:MAG: hypothetical protein HY738_03100 [Bacteroidia bacterium]|nr:hypothetical protein [Bacteroidia bacterium]